MSCWTLKVELSGIERSLAVLTLSEMRATIVFQTSNPLLKIPNRDTVFQRGRSGVPHRLSRPYRNNIDRPCKV